jgi:hypothetical protein
MKPQQELTSGYQTDFFRSELSRIVNSKHPMVKVAAGMDWEAFERVTGTNLASGVGAPRGKHKIAGVVALSEVRLRPK